MFEDSRMNIMRESLAVFEDIMKNPLFKSTPIYVFLNKKDIFQVNVCIFVSLVHYLFTRYTFLSALLTSHQELVSTHPLSQYFPDYDGGVGMEPALNFIKQKFRDVAKVHVPGKALQFCVVSALERNDIKAAFLDVKNALKRMVSHLRAAPLMLFTISLCDHYCAVPQDPPLMIMHSYFTFCFRTPSGKPPLRACPTPLTSPPTDSKI